MRHRVRLARATVRCEDGDGTGAMMKSILVVFHDDETAEAALATAVAIAGRCAGHITGFFVREPPRIVAAGEMAIPPDYVAWQDDEDERRADHARARFHAAIKRLGLPLDAAGPVAGATTTGPSARWREADGLERELVAERGRVFDLIAMGRSAVRGPDRWMITCEAALFESGRPVLLTAGAPPGEVGRSIVIAWNGSTETARTIALSMSLLETAKAVEVLSVEGGMVPGPSGGEVVTHLVQHGIHASARHVTPARGTSAGETVLAEARATGADLLIKGAYTHSRFRQMIFGGATQHILSAATLPVLLAH